jgi:hypothetical protein
VARLSVVDVSARLAHSFSPFAWAPTLGALTALVSVGLALATMRWVAVPPDTPHSRAATVAAGAIAFVALLVLPERRNWLALCLLLAAALAAVEATHDRPQWFAPTGYVLCAAAVAMGRGRLWWS